MVAVAVAVMVTFYRQLPLYDIQVNIIPQPL